MPAVQLRRLLPVVVPFLAAGLVSLPAPAAAATPDEASATAATWLADSLSDAGTVVGSFPGPDDTPVAFTDYGRTLDAAIALLAAGGHDDVLGVTLTSVTSADAVAEYTQGVPFDADDAAYAGATAKLAFVVEAAGLDATDVADVDLLAQLLSLVTPQGRLADRSDFGDFANLYGHAFALLALDTAGRTPSDALVQGLLAAQCADGSFPQEYEPEAGEPCDGQVDATGLVLQALAALDQSASTAATKARDWLLGQRAANGSFPGEVPVNSTGYAAAGLLAVGADITSSRTWLASQQNSDGGLRRGTASSTTSDVFATAQALPALDGSTFAGAARTVALRPVPCVPTSVVLPVSTITATSPATVEVRGGSGTEVELLAYSRPSTEYAVVRGGLVGNDGKLTFTVRPPTNTRLLARQVGCANGPSVVLNVRTALTLSVVRNGTRDYTFRGDSLPARPGGLVVSLYRITADGSSVLTAQVRASATTGDWTLRRVFSGNGRFGFVARTGQDLQNAPGASNVRSLLVY